MKQNVKHMISCGVFAALITVLTMITIPMPSGIPVTLQTFSVSFCGYMLGSKWGTISTGVYVALGAVGVPVFAGFAGGIGKIVGVTGGFIWGFLLLAACCGIFLRKRNPIISIGMGLVGLVLCHLCGVLQYAVVSGNTFLEAAAVASVPYLLKDCVSVAAAYGVSVVASRALRKASLLAI